ncbi:MAG TPA: SGNH/GDSL hydrolase family protein [Candidatus Limnocylindria bacterium]|nr:SGNH/GDSL hydrolase family protein [Candidatus Limnocylindria bacterium]
MSNEFPITWSATTHTITVGPVRIQGCVQLANDFSGGVILPEQRLALPPNTTGSVYLSMVTGSSDSAVAYTDNGTADNVLVPVNGYEIGVYATGPFGVLSMFKKVLPNDFNILVNVPVVQTLAQLAALDTSVKAAIVTGSNTWPQSGDGHDGAGLYFGSLPDSEHLAAEGINSAKSPGYYWFPAKTAVERASSAMASQFRFTGAGLSLRIAAGKLVDSRGNDLSYAGGAITLAASATTYVFLSLKNLTIFLSTESICRSGVLLGKVVTSSTVITSIWQPARFEIPKTRIPKFLAKLNSGASVTVLCAGDSILAGAGPSTAAARPASQLFSVSSASYGNNVPNVANVTLRNYSLGGASAIHGLALTAKLCTPVNGVINSMADGRHLGRYLNSIGTAKKTTSVGSGAIRASLPDLVIVEYGTNLPPTGTSQSTKQITAHHVEAQINQWRDLGVEVILVRPYAGNDGGQAARTYNADGDLVARIARDTGAELADWYGVMAYQLLLGNAVYAADNIHPSDLGGTVIANPVRGLIHTYAVESEPTVARFAQQRYGSYGYSNVVATAAEFQCGFTVGTGSLGSTTNSAVNLGVLLNGTSAGSATCELELNESLVLSHGACTEVWIQCELANGATATLQFRDAGNTDIVTPLTLVGSSNTQWVRLMGYHDFAANTGRLLNGYALGFQCGGTLKVTNISGASVLAITGVLFLTHEQTEIPFEQVRYGGTWASETARDHPYTLPYTDTVNSSLTFTYEGDYAIAYFEVGSQAGYADVWIDGEVLYANANLNAFGGGTYLYPMKICPKGNIPPTAPITNCRGQHTVTIALHTAGASPVAQNRSMALAQIIAFKGR